MAEQDKFEELKTAKATAKAEKAAPAISEKQKAMLLKKVSISVNDPARQNRPSEVITIGNDVIGIISYVVDYSGAEQLLPVAIINKLKESQYCYFPVNREGKLKGSVSVSNMQWLPAYNIVEIPIDIEEVKTQLENSTEEG